MAGHLDAIVALHRALVQLADLEEKLAGVPEWMEDLHRQHQDAQAELTALEESAAEAEREKRQAEGEIEDLEERLKRYQEQISQVSTQREYGALLKEIDTAKARIKELEEEALAAMGRIETTDQERAARREGFQELDQRYREELGKWEQEKPSVAARAEELRREIEALRQSIPRPVLAQFDRIAARYEGEAVAYIRETERPGSGPRIWHCSACHYRVRPQVVTEVQHNGSLVQCDSCKRILCFAEEIA